MREHRRILTNFSFYDPQTIQKKLEEMAAKGWMIRKVGNLFWTFEKIPPKRLHFAVTYFPGASEFDPWPSEKQLDKEAFCAQDGWKLVLRWDAMQIFCNDREDAVPIETDPVPQVENIRRVMKKKVLVTQLFTSILMLWYVYFQLTRLWQDPADYLSNGFYLFSLPLWVLLFLESIREVWTYFFWNVRARRAAEDGIFLPVKRSKWLDWGIPVLSTVFLLLALSGGGFHLLYIVCWTGMMGVVFFLTNRLMGWMKKKGAPRGINLAVSCACVMVLTLAGVAGIAAAVIGGWLPAGEDSQPVGQYDWDGLTMDIYDDPLPLTVEDLVEVDARWSKEARFQESPLVAYGDYRQDLLFGQEIQGYELSYEITDVKLPQLYEFVKERLISQRQDEVYEDFVFVDHYEPIDPAAWGAQEAYQLYWSDGVMDTYLICWETRIVEIKFYWTPTPEQIGQAAEILRG